MNSTPDGKPTLDSGVHEGVRWATRQAPMYGAINGYVQVPEGHPWRDLANDAPELAGVNVHGGLTYNGDDGWVGFDTLHYRDVWPDTPRHAPSPYDRHWTAQAVADETKRLAGQVAAAAGGFGDFTSRDSLDSAASRLIGAALTDLASAGVHQSLAVGAIQRAITEVTGR